MTYENHEVITTEYFQGYKLQVVKSNNTYSGLLFTKDDTIHCETQRVHLVSVRNNPENAIKAAGWFAKNTLRQHIEFGMIK